MDDLGAELDAYRTVKLKGQWHDRGCHCTDQKKYVLRFKGKIGERPKYTGRILAVGISYNKRTKEHSCKIEEL